MANNGDKRCDRARIRTHDRWIFRPNNYDRLRTNRRHSGSVWNCRNQVKSLQTSVCVRFHKINIIFVQTHSYCGCPRYSAYPVSVSVWVYFVFPQKGYSPRIDRITEIKQYISHPVDILVSHPVDISHPVDSSYPFIRRTSDKEKAGLIEGWGG